MNENVQGYLRAALWTSVNADETPLDDTLDIDAFAPEALQTATQTVEAFVTANPGWSALWDRMFGEGMLGHDLWLTRNGHGAGFWDRGAGVTGEKLTEAAHKLGESYAEVESDGRVYLYGCVTADIPL